MSSFLSVFITLLIFVLIFIGSIVVVSLFENCSIKEATRIVRKFLGEIFTTLFAPDPPAPQYYPVCVGFDGNRILPQLVDAEFSDIRANFGSCFYIKACLSTDGSYICYLFDIIRKPDSPDDKMLTQLIQKQAEEVVTRTMHLFDTYLPAEPLTFVELFPTQLRIAFARNESGIARLDQLKRNVRRRKIQSQAPSGQHRIMSENWHDHEPKGGE